MLGTTLAGVVLVPLPYASDERGSFERVSCQDAFSTIRPGLVFPQANISRTAKAGTIRGLHYQTPPSADAKLIRCIRGRVFDVAVDLRRNSPTFLSWSAVELSPCDHRSLFIPEGFAHGFQALEDESELLYMHTKPWSPPNEVGILFNDPKVGVAWPLPPRLLSTRDRSFAPLGAEFDGVAV